MKRPWLITLLGLALALSTTGVIYVSRTAPYRALEASCGPDLAWIKKEFRVEGPAFEGVRVLHEKYTAACMERCRQIDEKNRALSARLAVSTNVTPEIEQLLTDAAVLRKQCHVEMLGHFFEISRLMAPEQGRRYLQWMQAQTLTSTHSTMVPQAGSTRSDDARTTEHR